MKKNILLLSCLFLFFLQIAASQEIAYITIEFKEQSLKSALYKLEEASQFRFIFQDEMPDSLAVINQRFEKENFFRILDTLLVNTGYSYAIIGNRYDVIIYGLKETVQVQELVPLTVTGKIVDANGRFAIAAGIFIKRENATTSHTTRENFATLANMEGEFVITVNNPNTYLIVLDAVHLPRVVHIKDTRLIQLELDDEWREEVTITTGIKWRTNE